MFHTAKATEFFNHQHAWSEIAFKIIFFFGVCSRSVAPFDCSVVFQPKFAFIPHIVCITTIALQMKLFRTNEAKISKFSKSSGKDLDVFNVKRVHLCYPNVRAFVVIGSEAWMFIYIDIYTYLLLLYHILGYILHVHVLVFKVTNNFNHFACD